MKTYQLTAAQIVKIYNAGRESGHESATAYDWGSPQPRKYAELHDCLIYDLYLCGDIEYDEKQQWFEDFMNEA